MAKVIIGRKLGMTQFFTEDGARIAVTVIATFEGYDAPPTAEGVSRATTRTVVTSALTILILDLILTAFMLRAQD